MGELRMQEEEILEQCKHLLEKVGTILEKGFYYFYADETDKVLAQKRFKDSFCYFFRSQIVSIKTIRVMKHLTTDY